MKRNRKAKIVATLGPATSSAARIEKLVRTGVDVFRLNFSHGSHEVHCKNIEFIRELERKIRRPLAILGDLQGPKLRVGKIEGGRVDLEEGAAFRLDLFDAPGDATRVRLPHPEIFEVLKPGQQLMIDDGKIRLAVKKTGHDFAETRVIVEGEISNNKGVNVPDAVLPVSALTKKDKKDLAFALEKGLDWIALSFVQRLEDVQELKRLVKGRAGILAKLEKPSAVSEQQLNAILDATDAVMVARGDLGVEIPCEEVPALQKRIIRAARKKGRPVVVATQMLDSMVESPIPTRAEASDVATAIYDGADAVMLSAETAVGFFPEKTVAIMDRIIRQVEGDEFYHRITEAARDEPEATVADAITVAARQAADTISAKAIVTFTSTGSTSLRAARERPRVPIMALTPKPRTARRLALVWGLHPVIIRDIQNVSEMVSKVISVAQREELATAGDILVVTAGVPFGIPGATNNLRVVVMAD